MALTTSQVASRAGTWVRTAARRLTWDADKAVNSGVRWSIGYSVEQLLVAIFEEAVDLVDLLNDNDFNEYDREKIMEAARTVHVKLRNRALAAKLENVEGRTIEEAAVYRAKAEELRGAS